MSKKPEHPDQSAETESTSKNITRRDVIKGVSVAGGAVVVTKWAKPVVDSVILPAHAQATGFTAAGAGTNSQTVVLQLT
jgi:hypothetical protein